MDKKKVSKQAQGRGKGTVQPDEEAARKDAERKQNLAQKLAQKKALAEALFAGAPSSPQPQTPHQRTSLLLPIIYFEMKTEWVVPQELAGRQVSEVVEDPRYTDHVNAWLDVIGIPSSEVNLEERIVPASGSKTLLDRFLQLGGVVAYTPEPGSSNHKELLFTRAAEVPELKAKLLEREEEVAKLQKKPVSDAQPSSNKWMEEMEAKLEAKLEKKLGNKIDKLEKKNVELEKKIEELEKKIEEHEKDISCLRSTCKAAEALFKRRLIEAFRLRVANKLEEESLAEVTWNEVPRVPDVGWWRAFIQNDDSPALVNQVFSPRTAVTKETLQLTGYAPGSRCIGIHNVTTMAEGPEMHASYVCKQSGVFRERLETIFQCVFEGLDPNEVVFPDVGCCKCPLHSLLLFGPAGDQNVKYFPSSIVETANTFRSPFPEIKLF